MPEPQLDPKFEELTFRDPGARTAPRHDVTTLFWTGVAIFVAVAIIHPFYSYAVQTRLLAQDVEDVADEMANEMNSIAAETQRRSVTAATQVAELSRQQRLRSISLAGSSVVRGQSLVIVDLGQASPTEARQTICRLAERRFGHSMKGERLRVQRHRGTRPATELGIWTCG